LTFYIGLYHVTVPSYCHLRIRPPTKR